MNYIDILRYEIEKKKELYGGEHPSGLSCDEVLGLIYAIPLPKTKREICLYCGREHDAAVSCPTYKEFIKYKDKQIMEFLNNEKNNE